MEFIIWTLPVDQGDGSAGVRVFGTEEQAVAHAEKEFEVMGECSNVFMEDCVEKKILKFGKDGTLLNPDKFED